MNTNIPNDQNSTLKERLEKIMRDEFGITTADQLNAAYDNIDFSIYGIFTTKGEHKNGYKCIARNQTLAKCD